mgnify:CR=1 FL=1
MIRVHVTYDTSRQRWSRDGYLWSLCLPSYKNNLGKNVGIPIIASIFADTFIYYDVIRQAADLKAHELLARKCDPQERSDALRHREEAESKCRLVDRMRVWKHKPSDVVGESISIGDIRVTPFSNCHSIYDSHMFLIEADGKRIWHTGDYREHGYREKTCFRCLRDMPQTSMCSSPRVRC